MKKSHWLILIFNFVFFFNAASQPTDQIQKIISGDIASYDKFGFSVSISGDYAIIGVPEDDENGNFSGSAYIFYNNEGVWEQQTKLLPSDGESYDYFGRAVCISENFAIVGAYYDDDTESNSGSAYIFEKDQGGTNNWGQKTKLNASDPAANDNFGYSVSISGDYAVIGAYRKNSFQGAAYIFFNNLGNWEEQAVLVASDGATGDDFGFSVSISGNYAVVGADADDDAGSSSGSAYIFYKDQGTVNSWGQQKKITASDAGGGDAFGFSVSIDNNIVIIGAKNDGSAYLFNKDEGGVDNWGQIKKIIASDAVNSSYFGSTVSISGDYVLVGAYGWDVYQAAYLFYKDQGGANNWGELSKLVSEDLASEDRFGFAVCISGNYAIIGAPQNDENGSNSGAAYIFAPPLPSITTQPENQLGVCPNSNVMFSISGEEITSYQWQISEDSGNSWNNILDNSTYSGTATYNLSIVSNSNLLSNLYRCQVSNSNGTVKSNSVYFSYETETPVITSTHSDQTIGDGINCDISLPDYTNDVTATDNCDASLDITQNPTAGTLISGTSNEVTITVTDDAGNYKQTIFFVDVLDNTNPEITSIHDNEQIDANANCEANLPDYTGDVAATDNCDASLDITQNPTAGTLISGTSNEVTITVTDDVGNYTQTAFFVDVADNTNPTTTSIHNDQQVDADANCEASLPDYTGDVTASDNCDANLDVTQSPTAGTTISGILNTVTLTVTDDDGNFAEVSFNVEVIDNTNPEITCVENTEVDAGETHYYTVQGTEFDPAEISDNCGIDKVENDFSNSATLENAHLPEGTTTIVWTITDIAGNENTCSFEVMVNAFVGIETFRHKGISIYPNPTNGIVNLEFANNNIQKLTISDITGKQITEKTDIQQNEQIILSGFNSGIYIISIQTDNEIFTTKIIKE